MHLFLNMAGNWTGAKFGTQDYYSNTVWGSFVLVLLMVNTLSQSLGSFGALGRQWKICVTFVSFPMPTAVCHELECQGRWTSFSNLNHPFPVIIAHHDFRGAIDPPPPPSSHNTTCTKHLPMGSIECTRDEWRWPSVRGKPPTNIDWYYQVWEIVFIDTCTHQTDTTTTINPSACLFNFSK